MVKVADLPTFDMADALQSQEDIRDYLNLVLEENDPAELAHALGVIAKSKGMTQISKDTGITREALYKALRSDASPRFDTISRVVNACGFKLAIVQESAINLPGKLTNKIDAFISNSHGYESVSHFVQVAAEHELEKVTA
jgi:probable addiction module antidote protein